MEGYDVFIGLGSNLGNRLGNLDSALDMLKGISGIQIVSVSSLYETDAVGFEQQPDFLNAVALIHSRIAPEALLEHCQYIENALGRRRTVHWGPRTVDMDILLITGIIVQTQKLTVPHPRIMERAFVLVPLAQIAPDYVLPNGYTAAQAARTIEEQGITPFYNIDWERKWRCSDMKQ